MNKRKEFYDHALEAGRLARRAEILHKEKAAAQDRVHAINRELAFLRPRLREATRKKELLRTSGG